MRGGLLGGVGFHFPADFSSARFCFGSVVKL